MPNPDDSKGFYFGTVTEGDFLKSVLSRGEGALRDQESVRISDIIDRDFNPPVRVDVCMEDLFSRVTAQNFVPVTDDRGMFIGIVTRRAVMRFLCKEYFKK